MASKPQRVLSGFSIKQSKFKQILGTSTEMEKLLLLGFDKSVQDDLTYPMFERRSVANNNLRQKIWRLLYKSNSKHERGTRAITNSFPAGTGTYL